MAESAVSFLAAKIRLFLEENKNKLARGVKEDAEFIKAELERVSVLLRLAGTLNEDRGARVGELIKTTLELTYDIEDILDEFKSPQATHRSFKSKVIRCIGTIKQPSFPSKMLSIVSRIICLSVELQRLELVHRGLSFGTWRERRGDVIQQEDAVADVVGIDDPKRQLIEWLTDEDPSFKVISVVGMAGVGKTTLVRKVYEDVTVRNHFRIHAWITVPRSFRLDELLKDMIRQVISIYNRNLKSTLEEIETRNSHGLKEIMKRILQKRRYLIVIDDIGDLRSWDAIKSALPSGNYGSRVLLTTRIRDLAQTSSLLFGGRVYSLETLSWKTSWQLFCRRTFGDQECPPHLVHVARAILSKCEGLPLAIVVVANVLSTMTEGSADEWRLVNQNLGSEISGLL